MSKYLVILEEAPTSFGAYVPDLPGCIAVGRTHDEVTQLIREAITLHIEDMRQSGQPIPRPTSVPTFVEAA